MEIIETSLDKAIPIILQHLQNQEEIFMYGFTKEKCIHTGLDEDFDEKYCIENNIPVHRIMREGGTIVTSQDDLCVGLLIKNASCEYFNSVRDRLLDLLIKKGVNATPSGNDILIDGQYKVFGTSSRMYGAVLYIAIHISMNCDLDLIKNVCKKEMRKIPKGLSEYGVTKEEVLAFVLDEFNKLEV